MGCCLLALSAILPYDLVLESMRHAVFSREQITGTRFVAFCFTLPDLDGTTSAPVNITSYCIG